MGVERVAPRTVPLLGQRGVALGVNIFTVRWFEGLLARGAIKPGASILDLGPQDTPDHAEPGQWYASLGFGRYGSVDLTDPRATYRFDLNGGSIPWAMPSPWDVIYNGGTLEHVFNIGQAFATVHDLLAVGGLQLHAVPTQGDRDHGYYNIQPCLFRDLADANSYEVVDLTVVEDVDSTCARLGRPLPPHPTYPPTRDHIYVALRKVRGAAFVIPQQY